MMEYNFMLSSIVNIVSLFIILVLIRKLKCYKESIRVCNEMKDVQGVDGNWNCDNYTLGMFNGMEYVLSLIELRAPEFRTLPKKEIIKEEVENGTPIIPIVSCGDSSGNVRKKGIENKEFRI